MALKQYEAEPEIVAAGVAALCKMFAGRVDDISGLDKIDPKIRTLAALQNTHPNLVDLSNFKINIETADDEVLKLALITVGLNRDIENLFHPRCSNGQIVKALGQHNNDIVVQYSIWAVLENRRLTIDDLGVPLESLDDLPGNVQSKALQVIVELEPDNIKRHRFVVDGPFFSNFEAREGLAKGLRSTYYDGLADVTLDLFDQETHQPVREMLAEHFTAYADVCPPYEDKALSILEVSPELKQRLLLGGEGKSIYGKLRGQDVRTGTRDLFGPEGNNDFIDLVAMKIQMERESERMKRKVLVLSASPLDQDRLRIDQESRDLEEKLRLVQEPVDEVLVKFNMAVRVDQIQDAILNEKPEILHFSGHGGGGKLIFETTAGATAEVSGEALAELVELNRDCIKCVILSACYSEEIGQLIRPHIECVVGCDGSIDDDAAIAFTRAFYRAIANGRNYIESFKLGHNEVHMSYTKDESDKFVLL